ncbi:hypothetical protein FTO70_04330 [Methanosarcina sp. KYL-1]|uniref:hypothetical protein n=1 Tax=Methanosarcina sp. KYL-1 TaxID=2602068 RepID=UPI00210097D3|nr:hypothetical protein [Methanosarcina sp. KYL-1]MCQ1534928.1 hypothetical protein [Methanosarcina sp. KYL-1]
MKIKYIFLLLILTGIIINSGCVDAKAQPFTYKAPGNIYRSIFFPYAGLLNSGAPGMPGEQQYPHNPYQERPPSGDFNPEDSAQEYSRALREATALLDSNIEKAEEISLRLEFGIQQLQASGEDVSRLQELFGEYTRLVEEAKKYRELADSASGEENNYETQREYLVRSQKNMIQANIVLKAIFGEFQRLMPGTEQLNESSRLNAEGSGRAFLTGSFTLNAHLENGVMAILDISRDSAIYIKGDFTFEEQKEGPHNVLLYNIHSADVKIPGSSKTVMLSARSISLTAAGGKGAATFFGNGTYTIEGADGTKKEESWANTSFKMNGPHEFAPDNPGFERAEDIRTGAHMPGPGTLPSDTKRFIEWNP